MTPTITAAQRNALYDQILDRLSGIGGGGVIAAEIHSGPPPAKPGFGASLR